MLSLKEQVVKIKEDYGVKNRFFAKKLDISDTLVSLWLKGEKNLSEHNYNNLEKLIHELFNNQEN